MTPEILIDGMQLRFYVHMHARHDGLLVSEWLLELAKEHKLGGCSVFRAIAGFGRHGVLHEEAFFELADDLPVVVEFLLRENEVQILLQRVRDSGAVVVYSLVPARFGLLGNEENR